MTYFLKINLFFLIKASKQATTQAVNQKPQRAFLRKGQGLARFKGKSTTNKTVGQPQGSATQSTTIPQKKEKKTGNPVPSVSQGSNKLTVPSGLPVAQGKVRCTFGADDLMLYYRLSKIIPFESKWSRF